MMQSESIAALANLYTSGMSCADVAAAVGCCAETVRKRLRQAGIARRLKASGHPSKKPAVGAATADRIVAAVKAGIIKPDYYTGLPDFPSYVVGANGDVVSFIKKAPRLMKPIRMGNYRGLQLRHRDGHLVKVYLHRLVCEAIHGPGPEGTECCHRDGNSRNNDAGNLRWDTHINNEADKEHSGTRPRGERSARSKLTAATVLEMRRLRTDAGLSYLEIGRRYGVATMTARRAIVGESWSHI
jgi:hypothetical protein